MSVCKIPLPTMSQRTASFGGFDVFDWTSSRKVGMMRGANSPGAGPQRGLQGLTVGIREGEES